jgi:hypothetical protein
VGAAQDASTKASNSRWSAIQRKRDGSGGAVYGSIPVETDSPASIQAVVPPATLIASTPRDR